jgi:hypothetical protein
MLKSLGATHAPRTFFDSLLRELASVPMDLSIEVVRNWSRKVTLKTARDFDARWSLSRPGPVLAGMPLAESAPSVTDDFRYLSLANLLLRARPVDTALSAVSHCALRSFAHRLPGFARSSAKFLHTNFLNAIAHVKKSEGHWQVHITRPPLHIVLAMTGVA